MAEPAPRPALTAPPETGGRPRGAGSAAPAATRAGGGYSRFVSAMRIALPLIAGAIVALVVAWPEFGEKPPSFRIGVSKVSPLDRGGQQMVSPRFTGTDRNGRPYEVTADAATQSKENPDEIALAFPKADLTLRDGTWVALSAAGGRFDHEAEILTLKDGVDLYHDRGYELHTQAARVDLARGEASGDRPVRGQGPLGTLEGRGFRVWDKGRRMLLTGRSRMVLYPTGGRDAP